MVLPIGGFYRWFGVEVGFGKEMVICVLAVVEQLTKLTLNHLLGQIGPVST